MIVIIHGVTGTDNHSAVVGAVEADNAGVVKIAIRQFDQRYGKGPLTRQMFNRLCLEHNLRIVPCTALNYNDV